MIISNRVRNQAFAIIVIAASWVSTALAVPHYFQSCVALLDTATAERDYAPFLEAAHNSITAAQMYKASRHKDWGPDLQIKAQQFFEANGISPDLSLHLAQTAALVDWDPKDVHKLYSDILASAKGVPSQKSAVLLTRAGAYVDWAEKDITTAFDGFSRSIPDDLRAEIAQSAIILDWAPKDVEANYTGLQAKGYELWIVVRLAKVASYSDWNVADVDAPFKAYLGKYKNPIVAVELTQMNVALEIAGRQVDLEALYDDLVQRHTPEAALAILKGQVGLGVLAD